MAIKTKKKTNPSGILTKREIEQLKIIQLKNALDDDRKCYSNASYDLRLGDEYYIPRPNSDKNEIDSQIKQCSKENDVLKIKPFTSIVISTFEQVNMPLNVCGRFDLRIQWALQGLILQVGTQIEPGYNGKLFGLLHNFSKKEICIPYKSRLLTAEFLYTIQNTPPLDKETGKIEATESLVELKKFLKKYPAVDGTLENYLDEIKNISEEAKKTIKDTKEKAEKAYTQTLEGFRFKSIVLVSLLIALFSIALSITLPVIITKMTIDRDDYPYKKVYDIEIENKQLHDTIESMKANEQKTSKSIEQLNTTIEDFQTKIDGLMNSLSKKEGK